jgi:hypothetical protein
MIVIKELLVAQEKVKRNIANGKDINLNTDKFKALEEILDYVLSLRYLADPKLREKVTAFLTSGGKKHQKVNIVAEQYRCTPRSVEILLETTSARAQDLIGKGTLDLIMLGDIDAGMLNFKVCSTSKVDTSKIFVKGVDKLLPAAAASAGEDVSVLECLQELFVLGSVSNEKIRREIEVTDKAKMAYLLYLISSTDNEHINEKKAVIDFLDGCIGIEKVIDLLTPQNID